MKQRPGNAQPQLGIGSNAVPLMMSVTGRLTRSAYLPQFLSSVSFLSHELESMFTRFKFDERPLLRIYVDGGQRFGLSESVISRASRAYDDLEQRLGDCVGASRFCITLNGLTKWSERFTSVLQREFLRPLFSETGQPCAGCDFYAFIGNYGYTPFGIHDDDDHSILLHIGPGMKTAYVWERDYYVDLTGHSMTTINFAPLLASGRKYELAPGDLLFIPKGDFHILDTRGFSIMLGLTIFPYSQTEELRQAIEQLAFYGPDETFFASDEFSYRLPHGGGSLSVGEMCRARRLTLQSNGYITTAPTLLQNAASVFEMYQKSMRTLKVERWHPVLLDPNGNASMFVRGRKLEMNKIDGIHRFISYINDRSAFTIEEVISHMNQLWDCALTETLLKQVLECRGVVLAEENGTENR